MSSNAQQSESSTGNGSAVKHAAPVGNSPSPKRAHLDVEAGQEEKQDDDERDDNVNVKMISEADVGISAYVNDSLVPMNGGIIKHRFSDFQVREVSVDGTVCHITSLYPTPKEQGGTGLYEFIQQQEAEMSDPTGSLFKERKDREAIQRAAKEQEKQEEAEKVWVWQVPEAQEADMIKLIGEEALEQLKILWEEGPQGWKKEIDGKRKEEGAGEADSSVIQDSRDNVNARGGRADRGRGGRGGRGGGRASDDTRHAQDPRFVMSRALSLKEERTAVHQLVREAFGGNLTTDTIETPSEEGSSDKKSMIRLRWMSKEPGRMRFDRRETKKEDEAPPYIHFLLQKTNRESQDAMNLVAKSLGLLHPGAGGSKAMRDLSVAGTKDKRAVTVQRVAFRRGRRDIDEVWRMLNGVGKSSDGVGRGGRGGNRGEFRNSGGRVKSALDAIRSRGDRGIRVGHLEYAQEPLHLGMLQGNEFVIVLREIQIESRATVDEAISILREKGFINYYGMQRFGTSVVSTHTVGLALLRNDFQEAVSLIMATRPGDSEEVQEARKAYEDGDVEKCLKLMPHYNVSERAVLQRILADKQGRNDWKTYFMAVPRGLRTMYVHAYQSYIWNRMVTERVKRFGLGGPVIGDLVYVDDASAEEGGGATEVEKEADAEEQEDAVERIQQKSVKELQTEEEVRQYTIHDIVMPLPGNEIQLSEQGWLAKVYRDMLAEDKLSPQDIGSSSVPEFALKGDYRKVLHLPRNISYQLLRYRNANSNLCQSDEDQILNLEPPNAVEYKEDDEELDEGESVAMLLRLTLGVSAYATMALREVLKQDTSVAHQKELTEKSDRHKNGNRGPVYRNEAVNKIQGKQLRTWGAPKAAASNETDTQSNEAQTPQTKIDI